MTPGGSSSPPLSFSILSSKARLIRLTWLGRAFDDPAELVFHGFVIDANLAPVGHRQLIEIFLGQLLTLVEQHLAAIVADPARQAPPDQKPLEPAQRAFLKNANLVVLIFSEPDHLFIFDDLAALVLAQPFARENPHVDDRAFDAGRHPQRGIAHFAGLLAEDRAQQFFFGRKLSFALGGNLADQDIAGLNLGADANNAALVEIRKRLVADIGNIPGDFFGTELGIARNALELFDVNRSVNIFFDHPFADQNRIFEVVAAPGHQRDDDVAPQSELAHFRRRTIGDDIAGFT